MEETRQVFAVLFVLGLLGGILYLLRRTGAARFAIRRRPSTRRMQAIDRLPLSPHHSLHLVRVDGRTLLIALSPGACSLLDGSASTAAAPLEDAD